METVLTFPRSVYREDHEMFRDTVRRFLERNFTRWCQTILCLDDKFVLARLVAEIRNELAVR